MPEEDKMGEQLMRDFSLVLLTAATVCERGSEITVQVPFAFRVGFSVFPAGEHRVETDPVTGMLSVKAIDSGCLVMIPCLAVPSLSAPVQNKLVFTKYMDEYFLFQVWKAGSSVGCELRSEIEVATRAMQACRSIAAASREPADIRGRVERPQ